MRSQAEINRKKMMIIKDNRNKMMMMMNSSIGGSNSHLDDDLVFSEILSRLPVKSLMRFKSVCKRWMSSIRHDPQFHQLHYNHSETRCPLRFFIGTEVLGYDHTVLGHQEYFLSAAGSGSATTLHTFLETKFFHRDRILNPVNGLVCLADELRSSVCIYNPSTREETQRIQTTTKRTKNSSPRFVFGFDPVTKKHKVLCIHRTAAEFNTTACEVLTVGENSWRRIDHDRAAPYYKLHGRGVYVNGAIYWMNKMFHKNHRLDDGGPEVLVAFDVGSEKFRAIPIPDLIFHQPREPYNLRKWSGQKFETLEVDGRVAVLYRRDKNTASMWILFDDHHHHNWNWTQVTITLPFDWVGKNNYVWFRTIPGMTGQILVKTSIRGERSAYSYNWKKNAFTKVELSRTLSLPVTRARSRHTPFAESLFPVNNSTCKALRH